MYRPEHLSIDGTRYLGRWNSIVPVYDVSTMHGLNAIVGCVKHNNAEYGTVLYRGQANLHEKLIPSILHGNPDREEIKRREKAVGTYINNILRDKLMQTTLHFGEELNERRNYKKIVIEAMLQHYGVRTHCQDFVDNHWTALWFALYELKKCREKGQTAKTNYYNYYYVKRKYLSAIEHEKPSALEIEKPEFFKIPPEPEYEDETDPDFISSTAYKNIMTIKDKEIREQKLSIAKQYRIDKIIENNSRKRAKWENAIDKVKEKNERLLNQYHRDLKTNIEYAYLLLYVADTRGDCFRGVYAGTEANTIDLRKALPSVILRPCAQHGWVVKKLTKDNDLSTSVACVLRIKVELIDKMLGDGDLVKQKNFFPSADEDSGYRILLGRESIAPFGHPKPKGKKDLPILFPYSTFQHYIEK